MNIRPLGLLEEDLSFCTDQPFDAYRPGFAVERANENEIWLTDHGRRIALVYKPHCILDLFEFFPGRPRLANPQLPAIYHAPTMLGARITLAQWLGVQGRSSDTWEMAFDERNDCITLTITETWKKPQRRSTKRLELRVDPRFGYVLYTADAIWSEDAVGIEVYNFLVQGLTHHHPGKRRYPFVLWHAPSRGLLKWTSNMVSLRCAGQHDNEHARNLGTNGWVGFFGEPDWNPVFALADATQPCTIATCDNLLDEHLGFAAMSPSRNDSGYELSCRGVLLALPAPAADTLVQRAAVNDLKADQPNPWWPYPFEPRLRPFCLNQTCDFETPVPLTEYFRGGYWMALENGDDWATISEECVHSGRWALRLRVRPSDGEKSIFPLGSSLWLATGHSYRVSAHVCYRGNAPSRLRLRASQGYYSWSENREPVEQSCDAPNHGTWHRLEITFRALPKDPCVLIQLIASGDGNWFVDDMTFEEIP